MAFTVFVRPCGVREWLNDMCTVSKTRQSWIKTIFCWFAHRQASLIPSETALNSYIIGVIKVMLSLSNHYAQWYFIRSGHLPRLWYTLMPYYLFKSISGKNYFFSPNFNLLVGLTPWDVPSCFLFCCENH